MLLARVEGTLVATRKDLALVGRKLLLLRPQLVDAQDPTRLRPGGSTVVAVDGVGAGQGELVLFCRGARRGSAPGWRDRRSTRW